MTVFLFEVYFLDHAFLVCPQRRAALLQLLWIHMNKQTKQATASPPVCSNAVILHSGPLLRLFSAACIIHSASFFTALNNQTPIWWLEPLDEVHKHRCNTTLSTVNDWEADEWMLRWLNVFTVRSGCFSGRNWPGGRWQKDKCIPARLPVMGSFIIHQVVRTAPNHLYIIQRSPPSLLQEVIFHAAKIIISNPLHLNNTIEKPVQGPEWLLTEPISYLHLSDVFSVS